MGATLEQQIGSYTSHLTSLGFRRLGRSDLGGSLYYILPDTKGRKLYVELSDMRATENNRGYVQPIFDPKSAKPKEDYLFNEVLTYILTQAGYEFCQTQVELAGGKLRSSQLPWLLGIDRPGDANLLKIGQHPMRELKRDITYISSAFMQAGELTSQFYPLLSAISEKSPLTPTKRRGGKVAIVVGDDTDSFVI